MPQSNRHAHLFHAETPWLRVNLRIRHYPFSRSAPGAADEGEPASAMTESAAPGRTVFVTVGAASDKALTSSDKVGAILRGREDRQSGLHRSRSRWRARAPAWLWLSRMRRGRHPKPQAIE